MVIEKIRTLIETAHKEGKNLATYHTDPDLSTSLFNSKINVELEKYKKVILQEETALELGGTQKSSTSLIYPIQNLELIHNGTITLLGKEVNSITEKSIDFGLVIFIGIEDKQEIDINKLRQLSFISNSIEGFIIRTIPRKFWCRISKKTIKNGFSFEFLGNCIIHLYRQKHGNSLKSIEVIFINSYPDSIKKLAEITSDVLTNIRRNWTVKIEKWKKNIDCEYAWACEICPYKEKCKYFKDMLVERDKLEN